MTTKVCDQKTVGVIIRDHEGRHLLIERGTAPVGMAPVAGHHDLGDRADHWALRTPADVALAEAQEEVGLTVEALAPTAVRDEWVTTWCRRRRPAGATVSGHRWTVYEATATGTLTPDDRETRGAAWYSPTEVQRLATRTANYTQGRVSESEWQARPGLEPVWVTLYAELGSITLPPGDLGRIATLATIPQQ